MGRQLVLQLVRPRDNMNLYCSTRKVVENCTNFDSGFMAAAYTHRNGTEMQVAQQVSLHCNEPTS